MGDTKILKEQLHIVEEMEVNQEQPQQNEEIEGKGSDTQEPATQTFLLKLPPKLEQMNQRLKTFLILTKKSMM